jgi:hypothetical protein
MMDEPIGLAAGQDERVQARLIDNPELVSPPATLGISEGGSLVLIQPRNSIADVSDVQGFADIGRDPPGFAIGPDGVLAPIRERVVGAQEVGPGPLKRKRPGDSDERPGRCSFESQAGRSGAATPGDDAQTGQAEADYGQRGGPGLVRRVVKRDRP